jgi:putative aminopeptidase FrvX
MGWQLAAMFAAASGHVMTLPQLDKSHLGFEDMFVDIGVTSRREAESVWRACRLTGDLVPWSSISGSAATSSGKAMD